MLINSYKQRGEIARVGQDMYHFKYQASASYKYRSNGIVIEYW